MLIFFKKIIFIVFYLKNLPVMKIKLLFLMILNWYYYFVIMIFCQKYLKNIFFVMILLKISQIQQARMNLLYLSYFQ